MINCVLGGVVLAIVGGAMAYIVKEKQRGARCVGCNACSASCSDRGDCGVDRSEGGCSGCRR